MTSPIFKLNNGTTIPAIGLGTWQSPPNEVAKAVEYALKEVGYRHIDAAWLYGNEKEVGEGLKASGVPRSEVFITSKLWGTFHRNVEDNLNTTLTALGTDYLDLYLIHWPVPLNPKGNSPLFPTRPDGTRDVDEEWDIRDTWKQLEALYKAGKVKAIGVSNFSQPKLEYLLETAEVIPAVDQLELHLYNPSHKLLAFLKEKGILAQAYSPLGGSKSTLLTDENVVALSQKYSVDPAGVLLGYLLAKDIVILPKSVTPARIASNYKTAIEVASKIQPEEIEKLDGIAATGKQKRFLTPAMGIDLQFDNWP